MSDKSKPPDTEPATENVTFSEQYLSYFPGETASFTPDQAQRLTDGGVAGGATRARSLFRVDQPLDAQPTPPDYDPQHRDLDPNRPGNFPTRQHRGPPERTDPPAQGQPTQPPAPEQPSPKPDAP